MNEHQSLPESLAGNQFQDTGTTPPNTAPVLPLRQVERQAIEHALSVCRGHIPRAAALLQVSPSTLYRKKAEWDAAATPAKPEE